MRKILLVGLILIGVLMGSLLGYTVGSAIAINWCVDKGMKLLELKGIEIDVNEDLLKSAIQTYKNKIDNFLK